MRAIVVEAPGEADVMRLVEVPDPEPGPRDVVIRVAACGVCFHDVVTRNGVMKRGIRMPLIPGHEIAGTVAAVGPAVRRWRVGDRVASVQRRHVCRQCRYCRTGRETSCPEREFLGDVGLNGGYAEYVLVEEDNLVAVPPHVDLEAAAITACAIGTELGALRDAARLVAGEVALVTGAGGGLGQHGVQVAKACGAFVIGVTTTPAKAEAVRAAGADAVVVAERGQDFSEEVLRLTDGYGADVVLDNVGSAVFHAARRSLAVGGRWVLVGQLTGDFVSLNPAQLFFRAVSVLTQSSTSLKQLEDAMALVARGQVRPVVDRTLPLEDAPEAHRLMERGAPTGRLLLKPA
ncbi:MAG: alcohol dehydrogenase catalytic domain-containing protein [Actinomycetia bacterium]|nr:alcohol dehydrogenase catalytic domain-containing protein [Actinomycetes bacterium]